MPVRRVAWLSRPTAQNWPSAGRTARLSYGAFSLSGTFRSDEPALQHFMQGEQSMHVGQGHICMNGGV